jgi:hypothetical protein
MGIKVTGSEMKEAGKERDLNGKSSKADVSVSMKATNGGTTHVEVVAREGTIKWNKDYAREVLSKIAARS